MGDLIKNFCWFIELEQIRLLKSFDRGPDQPIKTNLLVLDAPAENILQFTWHKASFKCFD
jgi:hypothetical protein